MVLGEIFLEIEGNLCIYVHKHELCEIWFASFKMEHFFQSRLLTHSIIIEILFGGVTQIILNILYCYC